MFMFVSVLLYLWWCVAGRIFHNDQCLIKKDILCFMIFVAVRIFHNVFSQYSRENILSFLMFYDICRRENIEENLRADSVAALQDIYSDLVNIYNIIIISGIIIIIVIMATQYIPISLFVLI